MDVGDRTTELVVLRADRRRAFIESLGLALIAVVVVGAGVAGLLLSASNTIRDSYLSYVAGVARMGAVLVDPALHNAIRNPSQLNDADYRRAVEPLRRLRKANPDVRFIYTMVHDSKDPKDRTRFILDAADPGVIGETGIPDQSGVWEPLDGALGSPALLQALGDGVHPGVPGTNSRIEADRWGGFISGFAPLIDASGHQFGVVGVDIRSDVYLKRLKTARYWALLGLIPALVLIGFLSAGYYRLRLRMIAVSRRSEAAIRQALASQQRLSSVIEGTGVGVWDSSFGSDVEPGAGTVDEQWAAMLGYTLAEINPISSQKIEERFMHPEDVLRVRETMRTAMFEGNMVQVEARMRHADGHWIWVEARAKIVERDAGGRPLRMVGIQVDITARKEIEQALLRSESDFRSLFELAPVGIVSVEMPAGRYLKVNEAMAKASGYTREELECMTLWDLTPQERHAKERQVIANNSFVERFGPVEREYVRKDGSRYPVLISGVHQQGANGTSHGWAIIQDISERKAMEDKLVDAARRDRLTGLANRPQFLELLQAAVDRVQRGTQTSYAVLFLDFDRFKLVNDAMGHEAGDSLLREIAQRLSESLHEIDPQLALPGASLVARFGGDEFLILVNDVTESRAQFIAERVLVCLSRTYTVHGREVYSTASIGIVTSAQGVDSADAVVRNADVAMYEAKRSGRACAVLFNEFMRTRLTRHVTVESGLRKALGTDALSLVYQPIIELNSGRMTSVEALCRWHDPHLGTVSPAEFIPVAEESGLIITLGQWVLRESCTALARWRRVDPVRAPDCVSVNISRAELALGERLLARVRETLEETGLPPRCLVLEVTEREVMRDPKETLVLMRQLRGLGVRLAMDDFGTGTSSLGCLRDFPFDIIKIDRSFVQDVTANPDVLAVIHATVTLVQNLGRASVAEGVEEREQVAVLQSLGCQFAQGYFFSHPMTAQQMSAFMLSRTAASA